MATCVHSDVRSGIMRLLRGARRGERDNQAVAELSISHSNSLTLSLSLVFLSLSAHLRLEPGRESAHKRQAKSIPEYSDLYVSKLTLAR